MKTSDLANKRDLVRALLKQQGVSLCDKPRIQRRANLDVYPLSFAQQRLWFLDRFDTSTPAYNISLATRLDGPLDLVSLSMAFQEITRRHEVLRSTFVPFEGQVIQLISEPSNESIPVVDLSALPVETRNKTRRSIVHDLAQTTFDLSQGPLVNFTVLRLAPDQHVISLTMHHIVSDGWSADILMRELTTLYGAYAAGEHSPLAELPIQYADFAQWQREYLSGETLNEQLQYWRKQLAGAPMLPQLPTDRVRPAIQTFRGARVHQEWPGELGQQLKNLSQQEGVTLFMTLLAAFQLLLARWSNAEDVVVGAPIAGRHYVETEPLIGCFINTLVMRTSVSGNPNVRELLQRVREMCLQAYAHQDVPFEKLVEELQPERNLSHSPLFQVLFLMQYAGKETGSSNALTLVPLQADTDTAKFDISLLIEDGETGLTCGIEYNTDLFDAATMQRMLGHYGMLLEGFVNNPARPISELSLLTPVEHQQVVNDWNLTVKDYGPQLSLHRSFETQVERTPNAVALVFENEQLTYAELNRRANQLAHHLRAHGVKTESRVGVMLERSLEMVISLFGILKAGAAYVPMDPEYPRDRLEFMLGDSEVEVLLTETRLSEGLEIPCQTICLDTEWERIAARSSENPEIALSGNNLAYMIYTSGSTGKPKGAMNTHAAIFNRLSWMQEAYRLTPADRVLQKTPFSFDVSVWEFFWPLMTGARLVVARPGGHRDSAYLAELIRRERITTLHFVPPMLQVFLAEDEIETCVSLRRVICSGEALSRDLQDRFYERLPRVELHNLYGPTEAAVDVTWWACDPVASYSSVPIGKPIANTQIYLLDQYQHPVPAGVPGELYIGGVQLARGYHLRPALTAEKFVPDPVSDVPGARLYRTGDLARHLADGSIEYLGRLDFQVKIRGFRIELGEIEAALMAHPAIREAVVVAREDGQDKRLVAYLLPEGERAPSNSELREALKVQLPDYMVPAQFVTVDAWPLSPNGKVDRRALPVPGRQHTTEEFAYLGPRTPAEEVLVSIWEQVLGLEQIGINDNFFGLGGDSIRSLQVLSLAKNRGLNFNLQQLFKYQTVRELAAALYTNTNGKERRRVQPFELVPLADRELLPEGLQDAYPLAKLQAGMIYHMALRPEDPLYHNVDSMLLRARFDGDLLEEACARIVERHPMLRTSFALSGFSEALQFVHHEARLPVPVDDIRDLSADEQERRIDEFIIAEKLLPFSLDRPPLLRFHIHLRTEETFQFTLTECHAIQDGWSLHTMLTEIFSYYLAKLKGDDAPEWEELNINYRDFVQLEREALESKECADYWEQKLEDCKITQLPRWNVLTENSASGNGNGATNGKAATSARVRFQPVEIAREVSEALKDVARSTATPLKSVLLAAHLKVMSLVSGETDVLTGVASNGRLEESGGERVVGLFLNTLPFRLKLPEGSWSELVKATFANEWELLPYRRYPMSAVQNSRGQKLYETAFNFIHFHVVESVLRTGDVAVLAAKTSEATSWVLQAHFSLGIDTLQVELQLEYDSMFISEEQIAAIAGHYANVLQAIAHSPHEQHHERQFLSEIEDERLLMYRQTVPAPQHVRAESEQVYVAPRTDMERTIAEIWKEVLRVDKVGLHDNFFDLGGHSLRMIEVTRRLQTTLNRVLPVMDMFEYPTVSAMVEYLSGEISIALAPNPDPERIERRRHVAQQQRKMRARR